MSEAPPAQDEFTAARAGDADAQWRMAQACDAGGRHDLALSWMERAARNGHAAAGALLGARLLTGYAAPKALAAGASFLQAAAHAGGAEATEIVGVLHATGLLLAQDWNLALAHVARAADLGEPRSRRVLALLEANGPDLSYWFRPPAPRPICESPRVRVVENFLPAAVCDWLIERGRGKTAPARVYSAELGGGAVDQSRSNEACDLHPIQWDLVIALVRARIATVLAVRPEHLETFSLLRYQVGQEFVPHHDFMDRSTPGYARSLDENGQRVITFLVYLNDDFEGGETEFPHAGLRHRGRKGDALFFHNVNHAGAPDPSSLHAGRAPTRGEKWIVSQFVRDRVQPLL